MGAIRTDHEVEINLDLLSPLPLTWRFVLPHLEPSFVFPEVGAGKLMAKKEGHIWHLLQNVKETLVEPPAVDGEDGL